MYPPPPYPLPCPTLQGKGYLDEAAVVRMCKRLVPNVRSDDVAFILSHMQLMDHDGDRKVT